MAKYKLTWKDLTWNDFKIYLFGLFKAFIPSSGNELTPIRQRGALSPLI